MNESNNEAKPRIDYDGHWKRLIREFFEQFIRFFMPELLPDVDLSQSPEFLEQELATLIPEQTAKGRMSVDKLLKIPMENGDYEHVFLHVEIQSQRKANFLKKTFKYFYRVFDSKEKAVTALVIYANDDVPTPHDRYVYRFRGTRLIYEFNCYLVRDADEETLLKSDNIFALVVLACKYLNRTKKDVEMRRQFKLKLFRLTIERGYSRKEIEALMSFIDFAMYLPKKINTELKVEFKKEKEQENMEKDYVISPTFDEIFFELIDEKTDRKFAHLIRKVEEQEKRVEEQEKRVEEQEKRVEEQREARIDSVRKLILSRAFDLPEIANITGIAMEEVLKIKVEMDAQN